MKQIKLISLTVAFFLALVYLPSALAKPTLSDEELLDQVQEFSLQYFLHEGNARTGLIADRAHNFTPKGTTAPASIAAVGFALTVYPVAVERGWLDRSQAREMTYRTLQFFLTRAAHEKGFFYHYLNMQTGERVARSELSPIDTALFLAGVLFAAEYFEDPQIQNLADSLYGRVDWPWMLHGGKTLALAWSPEQGFFKGRWDHYSENLIMYLLAIGSPTKPIPADSWQAIRRPMGSYAGFKLIQMPPLFTHQYSHIWVDFRHKNDGFADYFQNSVNAAKANRAFVMDEAVRFKTYGPKSWGLTASDGPFGYKAYGAPPGWAVHDGTIAPTGCISSIVFTPKESLDCMRYFYEEQGDRLWGRYGFSDAYNLDKNWFSTQVIGIDQGAMILMIENYRSEFVWKVMEKQKDIRRAMKAVGFKEGAIEPLWADPPIYEAPYIRGGLRIDGFMKDWPSSTPAIVLDEKLIESGFVENDKDLKGEIRFAWDEDGLYFYAKVADQDLLLRKSNQNIWQDDLIELFIDPEGDGLEWNAPSDFQIGIRANSEDEGTASWSWFQGGEDPSESGSVVAVSFVDQKGYVIEGRIRWSFLGVEAREGMSFGITPSIHDLDRDRQHTKMSWFFRNEEGFLRFQLGKIILKKLPKETA